MTIQTDKQSPFPGTLIVLYDIDLNPIGVSEIYYFTDGLLADGSQAIWRANPYTPIEFKSSGWEWNNSGAPPRPQISFGNSNKFFTFLVRQYGDLIGAEITRTRTLTKYLDGQSQADPNALFPQDIYRVERKVSEQNGVVVLELSSSMEVLGKQLPGRQVIRDACTHSYRRWTGSTFDYSKATCPYTGAANFDPLGNATTPANDSCGKRLSDCVLRFGQNAVLPTRAFPGVAKVRY